MRYRPKTFFLQEPDREDYNITNFQRIIGGSMESEILRRKKHAPNTVYSTHLTWRPCILRAKI